MSASNVNAPEFDCHEDGHQVVASAFDANGHQAVWCLWCGMSITCGHEVHELTMELDEMVFKL